MPSKLAGSVSALSWTKNLRAGQLNALLKAEEKVLNRAGRRSFNAKLPTGYGKTRLAAAVFRMLQIHNIANRMLYITPTTAQHTQFVDGSASTLKACEVELLSKGNYSYLCDINKVGGTALRRSDKGESGIFAITIQSLIQQGTLDLVRAMMKNHNWFVVCDEYHHFGVGKAWSDAVQSLDPVFQLNMSATPHRPQHDGAFGGPDYEVTYVQAAEEGAVKLLYGHAYNYLVTVLGPEDDDVQARTIPELCEELGVDPDQPELIQTRMIEKRLRFTSKYLDPMIRHPLQNLSWERVRTGLPLQAIIGAVSVSHAKIICEQVRGMYPHFRVDWVGTGEHGRLPEENKKILEKFVPPEKNGIREDPTLDVIVHVGICAEGIDSVFATEIIHCNSGTKTNSNWQENGRAARMIYYRGQKYPDIYGNIHFDNTSEFAEVTDRYPAGGVGPAIMYMMDDLPAPEDGEGGGTREPGDGDLPEDPPIYDIEFVNVVSEEAVDRDTERIVPEVAPTMGFTERDCAEKHPDLYETVRGLVFKAHEEKVEQERQLMEPQREKDRLNQMQFNVQQISTTLAAAVIKRLYPDPEAKVPSTIAGDIKKRINSRKKRELGTLTGKDAKGDNELLLAHWYWMKELYDSIRNPEQELPAWLR